jgi:hypothetical protein
MQDDQQGHVKGRPRLLIRTLMQIGRIRVGRGKGNATGSYWGEVKVSENKLKHSYSKIQELCMFDNENDNNDDVNR